MNEDEQYKNKKKDDDKDEIEALKEGKDDTVIAECSRRSNVD